MVLNSLNAIIDDILLEIRNANIAESEDISRVQIEQWIHQYRALLIKQDLDKGRTVNPGYVQVINPFAMTLTNPTDTEKYIYESVNELPKTIDLHYGSGMITIRDTNGRLVVRPVKKSSDAPVFYMKEERDIASPALSFLRW